jgi:hypothetical protein
MSFPKGSYELEEWMAPCNLHVTIRFERAECVCIIRLPALGPYAEIATGPKQWIASPHRPRERIVSQHHVREARSRIFVCARWTKLSLQMAIVGSVRGGSCAPTHATSSTSTQLNVSRLRSGTGGLHKNLILLQRRRRQLFPSLSAERIAVAQ